MMEQGPSGVLLGTPRHPYPQALLGSLVKNGSTHTPVLRRGESECPFYRRCLRAGEACAGTLPLRDEGETQWRCAVEDTLA